MKKVIPSRSNSFAVILMFIFILLFPISLAGAAEKVVNMGVVTPLSGKMAEYGIDFLRAIELAASEINAQGGITVGGEKYRLKVIGYDNEMKPAVAVKMAMRLRSLDNCPAIFSPESTTALSVMKYNEKEKFLLLATSTSPEFTEAGNKLVIRITTPFTRYCQVVMDEGWKQGLRKAALLVISFETSKRWSAYFEKKWREKGGEIVGSEEVGVNEMDYYSKLTKLISKNPDVILNASAVDETAGQVVKQARELGYKGTFIFSEACDGASLIDIAGKKNTEGVLISASTSSLKTPAVLNYIKRFKEKYPDGTIQSASPKGYEALVMVAKAMEKANTTTDAYKIRAALPLVVPVPSQFRVSAFSEVTEQGETGSPALAVQIKNGEKVILNQIN